MNVAKGSSHPAWPLRNAEREPRPSTSSKRDAENLSYARERTIQNVS